MTDQDRSQPDAQSRVDREYLLTLFTSLVEPIGRALPSPSEVILHDLTKVPNTVVKVYGTVTGRRIGDPGTDLLLQQAVHGFPDFINYQSTLGDGRQLQCSTLILRDLTQEAVAALCINTDLTAWRTLHGILESMIKPVTDQVAGISLVPGAEAAAAGADPETGSTADRPGTAGDREDVAEPAEPTETYVRDVDELAALLLRRAVQDVGAPVEMLRKKHKVEVIRQLQDKGFFLLRDAVEQAAEALGVTRFTIYNYLNEIGARTEDLGGRAGKEQT